MGVEYDKSGAIVLGVIRLNIIPTHSDYSLVCDFKIKGDFEAAVAKAREQIDEIQRNAEAAITKRIEAT